VLLPSGYLPAGHFGKQIDEVGVSRSRKYPNSQTVQLVVTVLHRAHLAPQSSHFLVTGFAKELSGQLIKHFPL